MSGCFPSESESKNECECSYHADRNFIFIMRKAIETWQKGCEVLINDLQSKIVGLTDMYKHLSIQVESYHDHKVRQIIENMKFNKRLEELEIVSNMKTKELSEDE